MKRLSTGLLATLILIVSACGDSADGGAGGAGGAGGGGQGGAEGGAGGQGGATSCGACDEAHEGEVCESETAEGCPVSTQCRYDLSDDAYVWDTSFNAEAGDVCGNPGACCDYIFNSGDHCDTTYMTARCLDGQWDVQSYLESCDEVGGGDGGPPASCNEPLGGMGGGGMGSGGAGGQGGG